MVAAPHTDRGRLTHVVAMIRNPYQLGRVMCDAVFTNLSALCPAHQVALACFRLCRTDQSYTVHHPHPYCSTTAGRPCLTKGKHPPRLLLPLPLRVLLLLVLRVLLLVLRCVPPSAHPSVRPRCSMRRSLPPPSLPPSIQPSLLPSSHGRSLRLSVASAHSLRQSSIHPCWDGCGGTRPSAPDDEQSPGPRLLQMNVHIVCDDAKQDAFHLQSALEAQYKKVKQMFPWITEACCTRTALPSYDDRETLCPQTLRMRFCCWYTRAPSARPSDSIDHRARPPRTGHRPIRSGGELPRHRSGDRQPRHWRSHGHQGEEDHLHGGG